AIFDVVVDLRAGSPTFAQWQGFELNPEERRALYIPKGFGHGFQALVDDTEVAYQMSTPYAPEASAGVHHDDPVLSIAWPMPVSEIRRRDLDLPYLVSQSTAQA